MQLSVFEMVKKGASTIIEVVDAFAREQINELNSSLNDKQNVVDNALTTTAKTIVGAINEHESDILEINRDLTPTYFQLTSSGSLVTIEQQDCWCQGNRIHIAFSATSNMVMRKDDIWAIVPNEYRGRRTRTCGYVHIDGNPDIYINSVMIDGAESGHIYQSWASSIPANTRVTFIADYFI